MDAPHNAGQEKAPLERGNFSATTAKHTTDSATNRDAEKCFSTWQARYALHGHCLHRTAGTDGVTLYVVSKWNLSRELRGLEAVATFYALIGGTL